MTALDACPSRAALREHHAEMAGVHLRDLFAADPRRFERFSAEAAGVLLDYSKNRLDARTLELLRALAAERGLAERTRALFAGGAVNVTEGRAAMHMALRDRGGRGYRVAGREVGPEVAAVLDRMRAFCARVRGGEWRGHRGEPVRDVVSLGIGGSDLGPRMACEALAPHAGGGPRVHFVANVDGADLASVLAGLDPATTLFVVVSKSFTTRETLVNAASARAWLLEGLGPGAEVARHFVAVSTNREAVAAFGIDPGNMFGFWDWVGGRFSVWSAVGLAVALAVGFERFEALLDGAHAMDRHFEDTPWERNLPVLLALIGFWYIDAFGCETQAVVPYDQRLARLPAYLQQLEMESNGKSVTEAGRPVAWPTAPVVWGEPGTNGQHAFFQLLHQGTRLVPVDLVAAAVPDHRLPGHHTLLLANCLAQAEALMNGRTEAEARAELEREGLAGAELERLLPHRVFPGNRPTNTLLVPRLDPAALGALLALYEHKVFVQGVLWGIDSFDQWGVELGKQLARRLEGPVTGDEPPATLDASTRGLLGWLRARGAPGG